MRRRIHKTSIYYIFIFSFLLFGVAFFSYLSSSPVSATNKTLSQFGRGLTAGELNIFSQNNILFYDPSECADGGSGGAIAGTGDFDAILEAKNADKSFFNGEGDVPSAQWSDTDTGSMKTLLETYGDLAYQLGRAVGAPYIAILVQMRYEDPQSVCGKNNFWGNGCDPSHAYAGGATIQGKNLGEGFVQYGKTLTNGMHDQALGVADPKEYLTKIGPTWVQGDVNGAGYGSIEGMKKSVDALTAFIESSEGQAIVQQFGNYQGGGTSSSGGGGYKDETVWEDGWIIDGFDGYVKEAAIGSSYGLPEEGVDGGHTQDYSTDGKPNKILLHSTEGGAGSGDSGLALYGSITKGNITGITPAHFTINLQDKKVFQHFSIDKPSDAIIEDLDAGIQIEIIGFMNEGSDPALPSFTDEEWKYLAKLLIAISHQTGIKLESSADWTKTNRYSEEEFRNYTGVLGHMHAPSTQNHDDPGDIWSKIESAINSLQALDPCGGGGDTGDFPSTVKSFAWTVDELTAMGTNEWTGTLTPKEGYREAYDRRVKEGKYVGSMATYADCGGFVTTLMNESGYEPGYDYDGKGGNTIYQEKWLKENWEYIGTSGGGFDTSQLQQADVYINDGHTFVFVGEIPGFGSDIASASWDTRVPQASGDSATESGFRVYRKKGQ